MKKILFVMVQVMALNLLGQVPPSNTPPNKAPKVAEVLNNNTSEIKSGRPYFILSKSGRKAMRPKARPNDIRQIPVGQHIWANVNTGFFDEVFILQQDREDPSIVRIKTRSQDLFLTLTEEISTGILVLEKAATPSEIPSKRELQKWRLIEESASGYYFIEPFLLPGKVIKLDNPLMGSVNVFGKKIPTIKGFELQITQKSGDDHELWFFTKAYSERNPDSRAADSGYTSECFADLVSDMGILGHLGVDDDRNISGLFPEWRTVGETIIPNGKTLFPEKNIQILEGRITDNYSTPATQDFPFFHFTHDFTFKVKPDPAYYFLLGKQFDSTSKKFKYQNDIEVEWESGVGQNNRRNPASEACKEGKSFGFYSKGHSRRDEFWNWPTINDWVHVEGMWIWDRGHPPAKTEIHPPFLVGIQRDLPEKYAPFGDQNNLPWYFATRCDVYANSDGNVIWNNKKLHDFGQPINMAEKDYQITFKHELPKPSPTAKLKWGWTRRPGDSFGQPEVLVFENGTAIQHEPHIVIKMPWKTKNVANDVTFAQTFYLYWDDSRTHGIASDFKIEGLKITLEKIEILDKEEGNDGDPGEFRLFADLGGKWFFLNELVEDEDFLSYGLGEAWEYGLYFLKNKYPKAKYLFPFDLHVKVYLPKGKSYRVFTTGWEADYMDNYFGRVLNPFLPCKEARKTVGDLFDLVSYQKQGGEDDSIGTVHEIFNNTNTFSKLVKSNNNSYRVYFSISKL